MELARFAVACTHDRILDPHSLSTADEVRHRLTFGLSTSCPYLDLKYALVWYTAISAST